MKKDRRHLQYRADRKYRVRCLGFGKEHTFLTSNRTGNRICIECRRQQDAMHVSPRAINQMKAHES